MLDLQAAAGDVGEMLRELARRDIKEPILDPDPTMELENRIAMTERFAMDFDTQDPGSSVGVHLSGLQWCSNHTAVAL